MTRRPWWLVWVLALTMACAPAPPEEAPAEAVVTRTHPSMGTELRVAVWTADQAVAEAAFKKVFDEFDRLEALMTTWRETSDVSRVNAAAGKRAVPVSPEVREVLRIAREISDQTNGKFDVTFGALSGLWRFDQDRDDSVPDPVAIATRLPLIAYEDIVIDERAGTVGLRREGMSINLGGIGKGYAVDRGVAILRANGFQDFMIQAGGDLYVAGRRGDRAWNLGIQDPRGPADTSFATIELSDETLSTSGDYERFFIRNGRRYHHILDPDTGQPARTARSVTLVTRRAVIADGLAKGVFLLDPQAGLALIEKLPDVEGVIVSARNEVLVSSGLKPRLTMLRPPTDAP